MNLPASNSPPPAQPAPGRLQSLPVALVLGLVWLVIVAQLVAAHWSETAQTLSDMDDAMRLVQVREFLAGRGWFDLHEARLGPPDGYDTHWSRLIDAGIAGLFLALRPFTDAAFAERLARTIWPMLWLIPALAGATAIAWRLAGRVAAPTALFVLGVTVALRPFGRMPWEVPGVIAVKLLIHPLVVFGWMLLLGPFAQPWAATAVLMASLPPALNVFVIARQNDTWIEPASVAVLIGTFASVITLTGVMWFLQTGRLVFP